MEGKSVLVVEEDLALARDIAHLLAPLGLRTEIAATAKEALDRAGQLPLDLALLDVRLPDGNGVELGSRLQERAPDAEVVFLTDHATAEDAAKAVGLGAAGMLVKPFTPERLVDGVSRALSRKREAGRALESRVRERRMQTLTRLATGLAHELRNPLNSALLQLQLGQRRLQHDLKDPPDEISGRLATVTEELARLTRVIAEFEACVQPARLNLEDVPAEQLLACADLLLAGAPRIAVRRESSPGLVLRVDRRKMEIAIGNLVQNAIEAMPDGGTVTLRAQARAGGGAVLEVEDIGVGIPAPEAIFDPFFSTKAAGTGLGLAVVQRIVTDHGGTIEVASRPQRTTFSISLPAAGARAARGWAAGLHEGIV